MSDELRTYVLKVYGDSAHAGNCEDSHPRGPPPRAARGRTPPPSRPVVSTSSTSDDVAAGHGGAAANAPRTLARRSAAPRSLCGPVARSRAQPARSGRAAPSAAAEALGQERRLIEAALPLTGAGERHRHERIDVGRQARPALLDQQRGAAGAPAPRLPSNLNAWIASRTGPS